MTVLDQPYQIAGLSLATLSRAVGLQAKGIRVTRGKSPVAIAKSFGYTGTAATIAPKLAADVEAHLAYVQSLNAGWTALEIRELALAISPAGRAYLLAARHPAFPA